MIQYKRFLPSIKNFKISKIARNLYDIRESRTMVETLTLIFEIVGLVCVISAMVAVILAFLIWKL